MKSFSHHSFDYSKALTELNQFGKLLKRKELNERKDILPFFKKRSHLSAFLGAMTSEIVEFNRLAHEFDFFGDFACDLAIGDANRHAYCFVEFEDAKQSSVFRSLANRSTPEWSPRFDHGLSQIVDWLWQLDDNRQTGKFRRVFGSNNIQYIALLVIGRTNFVSDMDRFRWRCFHTMIGHTRVFCYTYDQIYDALQAKVAYYASLSQQE